MAEFGPNLSYLYKAFGIRVREGLEQNCIHQAEHGHGAANPHGQRKNRRACKAWRPGQAAEGMTQIL
jgi:hypothetical protein